MGFPTFSTRQVALCAIFGGFGFALRAMQIIVPIGGPFVVDARDLTAVVGAAVSGPIGGIIIGILAGTPAKFPVIDIPSFALAYFLVGLLARRFRWLSGLAVLTGYPTAALIAWRIGLLPSFTSAMLLIAPRALLTVPIQLVLLFSIFKRWPDLLNSN